MKQSFTGYGSKENKPSEYTSVVLTETGTYREHVVRLWNKALDSKATLTAGAMGLSGEAGEVTDLIKKVVFHGHELDKEKLVSELGDVLYYAEILMNEIGVTRQEVQEKNLEKLIKRYPQGFSSEASKNRVD